MKILNAIFHKHKWGEWEYVSNKSANQKRICDCGKVKNRIMHEWSEWEYIKEGECVQNRICQRDGTIQERTMHQWGKDFCNRCGLSDTCPDCKGLYYIQIDTYNSTTCSCNKGKIWKGSNKEDSDK